jgi:D-alanine-D-alanine ligase
MACVALVYNLVHLSMLQNGPVDRIAEYDSAGTVAALTEALQASGHDVVPVEVNEAVVETLRAVRPQIVFNIAEGVRGESRESHIPAICEMLGLPYTGSGPLTLALCLDKARAKQILAYYRIPTPPFQVFASSEEVLDPSLSFPLIVKLLHEGSSMGLDAQSIVDDETALRCRVGSLLRTYHQPVIVETFIEGREFTIGILGNDPPWTLPITELVFDHPRGIVLFVPDDAVMPLVRQVSDPNIEFSSPHRPVCPAEVDRDLARRIERTALAAFEALGCRDWCRLEMRLGLDGTLYVLELNPIAGIDPSYWLPQSALVAGMSYAAFVNEIVRCALARIGGTD